MCQTPQLPVSPTSDLPSVPATMHIQQQAAAGPSSQAQSVPSSAHVYAVQIPAGYTISTIAFSNGTGEIIQQQQQQQQQQPVPTFVPAPGAAQNRGPGAPPKPPAEASDGAEPLSNIFVYVPIPGPAPWPYVAELRQRNAGTEGGTERGRWTEQELLYMAALERGVQLDCEERGRAFWKAWVDMEWSGLCGTCKDGAGRGLVEEKLKEHLWYRGGGDSAKDEATNAMRSISEIDRALMAMMGASNHCQAEGGKEGGEGKQKEKESE